MFNRISAIIFMVLIFSSFGTAQPLGRMKAFHKMEELKKIKLIETLQMDEETSIKFFSRRTEHIKRIEGLNELKDKQIEIIEDLIVDRKEGNLKKAVEEYYQIIDKIHKERQNFFNSVSDILSNEQLAKFIVFEERFRSEVSSLLLRERNKRFRD